MAVATVTKKYDLVQFKHEHVQLTVSDGETYTSRFENIVDVQLTWAENDASTNAPTYSKSGNTITIHAGSVSDKKLDVCIFGY